MLARAVHSVMFGASPYGVLDMAGNVLEYVNEWWGDTYYSQSPESNPSGPVGGILGVLHGGDWFHEEYAIRMSYRGAYLRDEPDSSVGFRCSGSP